MRFETANTKAWFETLSGSLPAGLKNLLQINARGQLLRQINTVLMVHEDKLYDLSNGRWCSLTAEESVPRVQAIANAAVTLLDAQADNGRVLLLLPGSDFLATPVNMPGVARENLIAAVQLQTAVILPSYESPLTFEVHTASAVREQTPTDIVLWTNERLLDDLFNAFEAAGLFLTAVMPRALAVAPTVESGADSVIADSDASTLTHLVYRHGVLTEYLQINRADLSDPEFQQQWQQITESHGGITLALDSPQSYLDRHLQRPLEREYCFLPAGAQAALRHLQKGRRMAMAAVAAVVLVVLAGLPFLWQSVQFRNLQANLNEQRELAAAAREDQAVVRNFEQRWGALNEFPPQRLAATLTQLQAVLSPSVLSSFTLDEGLIQIEGESDDPQSLLQQLEQDPMFTGVDFARATNNNRYYIEMRLSTVDFDAYRQRYFPGVRR
jgi:hypothetical protein